MNNNDTKIQKAVSTAAKSARLGLSTSKVSEWKLITDTISEAMVSFETTYNAFKDEVDMKTAYITPGTLAWYSLMSKRFQYSDDPENQAVRELDYDPDTGLYGYRIIDENARIIKAAGVSDSEDKQISIKVAKLDQSGSLTPLDAEGELPAFEAYISRIAMAGIRVKVMSIESDSIEFRMTIYHDPLVSGTIVKEEAIAALEEFARSFTFDSVFYVQQFIDVVMHVDGVKTVELHSIEHTGWTDTPVSVPAEPVPVGTYAVMDSGYFTFKDLENSITVSPTTELENL